MQLNILPLASVTKSVAADQVVFSTSWSTGNYRVCHVGNVVGYVAVDVVVVTNFQRLCLYAASVVETDVGHIEWHMWRRIANFALKTDERDIRCPLHGVHVCRQRDIYARKKFRLAWTLF